MIAMATQVLGQLAGEAFNGERILENSIRLATIIIGIPIAMVSLKFGWVMLRKGQYDRAWGTVSYALMLLVPAVGRVMNFGNPINWVTTGIYIAGLAAAGIALYYRAQWVGWPRKRPTPQEKPDE